MTQFGTATVMTWPVQVFLVLALMGLAVLVYRIMDEGMHHGRIGHARRGYAQRMLDARYARGEITAEEYVERIRMLSEDD